MQELELLDKSGIVLIVIFDRSSSRDKIRHFLLYMNILIAIKNVKSSLQDDLSAYTNLWIGFHNCQPEDKLSWWQGRPLPKQSVID